MSTTLAAVALVVAVLALLAGLLALRTLGRIRRGIGVLGRGGARGESYLEATSRHAAETAELRKEVSGWRDVLAGERKALAEQLREASAKIDAEAVAAREQLGVAVSSFGSTADTALRRVAVVRFDAFDDMGGRLSFSLALLDGHGDGIALTSIAGRSETRLYAKPVTGGVSEVELSPEEKQAVKAALAS